ncbi:class I mannose-6-phosphate isomerase [Microlunatus flavus]|uniref:Mannose-6-phosphate isomerase n=1 Tax=Microlunatus flavus TaxID=1036181 RepID=A0A1H9K670_9ACTN|nr:class I mannose-6-phosphate isomerase [Microlunatus flavus]SEQ94572.1 mannose-6-phosphate isomerase [Microlunatus flavus]
MTTTGLDAERLAPRLLAPNQPGGRPYRGGAGIAHFRGAPAGTDDRVPEDFLASTTTLHGDPEVGLTRLPGGPTLRQAVLDDPVGFLGAAHVERFGADPRLLVKLINPEQRLFVHYHPDDAFARARLGSDLGKTEAWVVVDAPPDGHAYVGFRRPVPVEEVTGWFERQDAEAMLAAMHRVPLAAGDTLLVPAGQPHAVGAGITLLELQQPTDLSLVLEHRAFPGLDEQAALLGLDLATALGALDLGSLSEDALAGLVQHPSEGFGALPQVADPYFRLEQTAVRGRAVLDAAYAVVVVVEGEGRVERPHDALAVRRGSVLLTTHGHGPVEVVGDLLLLRCRPPAP